MTPTKLTIWVLTSLSAAVIAIFVPSFGEDMWVLEGVWPITAFLCAAAVSGIALSRISDRHARRVAVGLAIGAFVGLVIGSNGPADAQAGLETLLTLPVGIVVGTFAGFLLRPRKGVVEELPPVEDC
jgi:MFS family permease